MRNPAQKRGRSSNGVNAHDTEERRRSRRQRFDNVRLTQQEPVDIDASDGEDYSEGDATGEDDDV